MMMECPRCGFVQPQDRFCANCGLNVANFVAKPKPLSQRLKSNPVVYVSLAVLLIVVVTWYLERSNFQSAPNNSFQTAPSAPVAGGSVPNPNAKPAPPRPAEVRRVEAPPPPTPTEATEMALTEPTPSVAPPATPSPAVVPAKAPSQVELTYYEIPREAWLPVAAEMKTIGNHDGWRIGQISNREKLTNALAGAQKLPGQRQMATQPSAAVASHFPVGAVEPPQGLFLDLSVVKQDQANVEMELAWQVDLKVNETSEIHTRYESLATLPPQGAIAIVGSLSRLKIPDALASQLGNSPLSILASDEFFEGGTEFIVIIQGK
jgi:hypothetical protein